MICLSSFQSWIIFLYPFILTAKFQITALDERLKVIASYAIFSKSVNVCKTYWISIISVFSNPVKCCKSILLDVLLQFAGLEPNQHSASQRLWDETDVDVVTSSTSRLDGGFPALRTEDMTEAEKVDLVNTFRNLLTCGALSSFLANYLGVKLVLHKSRPACRKRIHRSFHTYIKHVHVKAYRLSDPHSPVCHNLSIGYLTFAISLDKDQNRD